MTPYLPILVFALLYGGTTFAWHVPPLVGAAYLVMSLVCFCSYALDKSAARKGERRTPESTLLMLGLFGGWPGAVLAQQWLRHKTVKQPFRQIFWFTVAANLAFFLWLSKR
ncbi:hypothetical protein SRABI118_03340 [Massilia sp. Bi118]|uniref:DUF1294 domain-containing protein n=1 Tax=Massilia sp. Bi118 TaxID=2822346 RepID=UPI001DE31ABD|nr:DUF1294 domain-containing protein [Massilia sp. Bi118]CAH0265519.1 hypothetical protein SRABI118_03340 [Massilia sp. Bi118]